MAEAPSSIWLSLTVLACLCALAVAAAEQIRPGCLTGRSQAGADDEMLPTLLDTPESKPRTLAALSWWDRQKGLAELERYANSRGSQT